jgi:pseudaminic acid synthase
MELPFVKIGGRKVGLNYSPYVVAEMSANHLGDFDQAVNIVKAAAQSGADAIKLQTFTADSLSLDVDNEYFKLDKRGLWAGMTQHQLYEEAHMPWEWHEDLFKLGRELGIDVFSSPFDESAVSFLEQYNPPAYKIASYELVHIPLIKKAAATGKVIILSTGLATLDEIAEAIEAASSAGAGGIIVLNTIAGYPTPVTDACLSNLKILEKEFPGHVYGISDHSPGSIVPIASIPLGCRFIEKHLTISRADGGHDVKFSLEPAEMADVVSSVRLTWQALGDIKGNEWLRAGSEEPNRISRRSIFVAENIKKGEQFTSENIRVVRPHFGLKPKYYFDVLTKHATEDIKRGTPLKFEHIQEKIEDKDNKVVKYA